MKGYTIGTTMYVFDATPGQFPSVEATTTVIYVQEEALAAWKEANSDYATIIKPYNFNTITVQKPVWYDYIDEDIPNKQPTTYTISYEGIQYVSDPVTVAEPDETVSINLIEQAGSYTVEVYYYDNDDPETGNIQYLSLYHVDTYTYQFAMPAHPTHATITYVAPAQSYSISYDGNAAQYVIDAVVTAHENDTVTVQFSNMEGTFTVDAYYFDNDDPETGSSILLPVTEVSGTEFTFTMPAHPTYVTSEYTAPLHDITVTGAEAAKVETNPSGQAPEGNTVYVMLAAENYTFDKACTEPGVTILDVTSTDVSLVYSAESHYQWNDEYTFTMPQGDVTITVTEYTPPVSYNFTLSGTQNQHVVRSAETATAGTWMTLSPEIGYTFDTTAQQGTILTVSFTGATAEYDTSEDKYGFYMPAGDVDAEIEFYNPL